MRDEDFTEWIRANAPPDVRRHAAALVEIAECAVNYFEACERLDVGGTARNAIRSALIEDNRIEHVTDEDEEVTCHECGDTYEAQLGEEKPFTCPSCMAMADAANYAEDCARD